MQLRVIELDLYPVLDQLKLEEALLRTTTDNWCLINRGSPPAVVMGISQNLNEVVDLDAHTSCPVPLIRRYSGGGTVIVEPTTVLATLILNHDQINTLPFPKEVLKWTEALYLPAFGALPFALKENDYAIDDKKCGGNAQYFAKGRFVHHTSFLWDFTEKHMSLLQMPPKMPAYRQGRTHQDFLAPLRPFFSTQMKFSDALLKAISYKFQVETTPLHKALNHLSQDHRKSTLLVRRPNPDGF